MTRLAHNTAASADQRGHGARGMRRHVTLGRVLALPLMGLSLLLPAPFSSAYAAGNCAITASAEGRPGATGSETDPVREVQEVVDRLAAGQTGCVRGEIAGNVAIRRPDVTLTSEPGQRGRVLGQLKVMPGGARATVRDLDINGRTEPEKPTIGLYADDVAFLNNDVTNDDTEICIILGYIAGDIAARRPLIQDNRIHNCGERAPVTNMDHGIYAEWVVGGKIVGNAIYDNADRGIQLYPRATDTLVTGNVIDNNGVGIIFGGDEGQSANGNTVRYNAITNSRARSDIESWYPAGTPKGVGNVVERNCVSSRGVDTVRGGFTARDNVTDAPQIAGRGKGMLAIASGGVCADLVNAGRAGFEYAPPAAAPASDPVATLPSTTQPVAVAVTTTGGTPAVKVTVTDRGVDSARTVVQVSYGNGKWTTVAKPKVSRKKPYSKRLKRPRGAKKLKVRAAVTSVKRRGKNKKVTKTAFTAAASANLL
ncbi:MAG TPA: right-handed parallel beta-helix repeat-containing protein [Solirubrobacteraceae bacterium]|nr:right-handed parallel beta-helix repeat-containing protein [Solirubrobacteraceae bacterium]